MLAVIACVAFPLKAIVDDSAAKLNVASIMQKLCMEGASAKAEARHWKPPLTYAEDIDRCYKAALRDGRPDAFWPKFRILAWQCFLAACVLYVLAWPVFLTVRWVWRGRKYRTGITKA